MSRWQRPSFERLVAMIRTSLGADAYEITLPPGSPPVVPPDRCKVKQLRAAVRITVGDEAFASAWAEGRPMTLEQAVAYALDEPPPTQATRTRTGGAGMLRRYRRGEPRTGGRPCRDRDHRRRRVYVRFWVQTTQAGEGARAGSGSLSGP
jgi:hypothetical protein